MTSSQGKHLPKDTQIIVSIMKDLGICEFDQQVLNHLLEFNYRYATLLLDDAKTYSNFAKKKNVDVDDVKIAIQLAQDGVFIKPPPREVLISACDVNKSSLPLVKPASGLRIPHDRSNFLQTNFKLKNDLYSGGNLRKADTKTATEMLIAARKKEMEDSALAQSDQMVSDSMDFDLQDIIENRQNRQDGIGENGKNEHNMDTQTFENRSYTNIALDDAVEKQLDDM